MNKLKRFARGDIELDTEDLMEEHYEMTLDDFKTAIRSFQSRGHDLLDIDVSELYLFRIISILSENLGLKGIDTFDTALLSIQDKHFTHDDKSMLYMLMTNLFDEIDYLEDLNVILNNCIERIENYKRNKNQSIADYEIYDMHQFFEDVADAIESHQILEEDIIERYKKELVSYAGNHDVIALEKLAYSYYGSNSIYPCDWFKSRDYLLELMKYGDDERQACTANTLGYMYYYGRCNNGLPEYEEAYKYFSLSALFGYYEAKYKVADMIKNGYGICKNKLAAFRIYDELYQHLYLEFIGGDKRVPFADVALRLGSCYEEGVGVGIDYSIAYHYYLQAKYAIELRKEYHHYGDEVVTRSIDKALARMKEHIKDDGGLIFKILLELLNNNKKIKLYVEALEDTTKLTFKGKNAVFITHAPSHFCTLAHEFSIYTPNTIKESKYKIYGFEYDFENKIIHLRNKKKNVVKLKNDFFIENIPTTNRQFVSIRFSPSSKTYDYLCDDEISVGDYVEVQSYDGIKHLEVLHVFTMACDDLSFYKTVKKVK